MKTVLTLFLPACSLLLLLSGCATTLDLSKMHETQLDEKTATGELPAYVKEKKRPRVAILPIGDSTQYKTSLNLAQTAQDTLTQLIVTSGGVEVMERAQLDSFMQEMKFKSGVGIEVDADKFAQIAKDVDTVFVGTISSAGVSAAFTEASSWTDKKGKTYYTPASCKEEGKVAINFRALASPSGTIQRAFEVKGRSSRTRDVRYSGECQSVQSPGGLLSDSVNKAIDDAKEEIANTFPSIGYIYKTMTDRSDPRKRIAYINLGKSDGLAPGNKVDIIEFAQEKDRIKKTMRVVERPITEGVVSETQFMADSAILIIPEEAVDRVIVGQAVKSKANVSVFRMINKALK